MAKNLAMYFSTEKYRYWLLRPEGGRTSVKLQIQKKELDAFLKGTVANRDVFYVDILEVGGGWYSISAKDNPPPSVAGLQGDPAMILIRNLNLFYLNQVNANPKPDVKYVKRVDHRGYTRQPEMHAR